MTADPAATEASRKGDVLTIPARLKSDDLYMVRSRRQLTALLQLLRWR